MRETVTTLVSGAAVAFVLVSPAFGQGRPAAELLPIRNEAAGGIDSVAPTSKEKRFVGKLDLEINGDAHYCSAFFVADDVIATAAHCVEENGTGYQYDLIEFRYVDDNNVTQQAKSFECVKVPDNWEAVVDPYARIRFDYAFIRVNGVDLNGKSKLWAKDFNGKNVIGLGFPVGADLTGVIEKAEEDILHLDLPSFRTESLGFTQGTSGGPWIKKTGGGNDHRTIYSLNSSYSTDIYGNYIRVYGPVLDGDAEDLLKAAAAC